MSKKSLLTQYVGRILFIVFLTNIPALLVLPSRFDEGIAWIAGTIGSGANFLWLSKMIDNNLNTVVSGSELSSFKRFYLRYLLLALYSVLIVILLKPNILVFGLGLLSVQIAIYLNYLYEIVLRISQDEEKS